MSRLPSDTFADAVLAWGVPQLRDLPWRHTRDPWAIVVSEVMLQQTQAARVIPKFSAFIVEFPTPTSCASATLGDVLRLWHGLGYPRRARSLHLLAVEVASAGSFPDTLEGLLRLPGVGPYTARAVLAFAYERDCAVVDTNIARVYARVMGRRLTPKQVQAAADAAAPSGRSWEWNQSVMELGAVLCRPSAPRCVECPVADACAWRSNGFRSLERPLVDKPTATVGLSTRDDPAIGSAGVSSRQRRYEGSDRQARGGLLAALQSGPVERAALAAVVRRDPTTAERLLAGLIADGLVVADPVSCGGDERPDARHGARRDLIRLPG